MKIIDLDVLAPEKRIVKLGGNEIDISFIPLGITFEIDRIVTESTKLDQLKISENDVEELRKAFDISVDLCVAFCEPKYPEMGRQWFLENVDANQVNVFASAIRETLFSTYEKVGRNGKKEVRAKTTK